MKIIITLFGAFICLAGLVMLISPQKFKDVMNNIADQTLLLSAVIVRIIIGAVLLLEAPNLKFTPVIEVIGTIFILAAIILLLIGQNRLRRMIDWFLKFSDSFYRIWTIPAFAFGAFLIYVTL